MVIDPVAMAVINDMMTHILHRMITVCCDHVNRRGLFPSAQAKAEQKHVQVPLEYIRFVCNQGNIIFHVPPKIKASF